MFTNTRAEIRQSVTLFDLTWECMQLGNSNFSLLHHESATNTDLGVKNKFYQVVKLMKTES